MDFNWHVMNEPQKKFQFSVRTITYIYELFCITTTVYVLAWHYHLSSYRWYIVLQNGYQKILL